MKKKIEIKKNKSKRKLVIVESPAKAKTLKKFFGNNYKVAASVGHVRDLPKSKIGIDFENNFAIKYIPIRGKKEIIDKLKSEVKNSDMIYLATDPDREGEAIAWHLFELLKLKEKNSKRISFNEITKTAVKNSLQDAREINMNLVNAQQARRALDRIVGYKLSPILWHKIRGGLSAGRVQSVALKIICDREEERNKFIPEEYWTIEAVLFKKNIKNKISAIFFGIKNPDKKNQEEKIELKTKDQTDKILEFINKKNFLIEEIKNSSRIRKANPPFTTSTLQQEAAKNLNFVAKKTMLIAQELYEGIKIPEEGTVGLISYIRTDSVRISDEAHDQAKKFILDQYGEKYSPIKRKIYKSKKNIQDAHEAIRPTYASKTPEILKDSLSKDQYKLYKLIWQRFMASQMSDAIYDTQSIKISCEKFIFKTSGSVLKFDGYLRVYDLDNEKNIMLPELKLQDELKLEKINSEQHFTQPPARFNEASLVKTLEESGVGRPSTYATIISNIQTRGYVKKENKNFYPVELGQIVNKLLEENFEQIVNINFTSQMELDLDKIEDGELDFVTVLKNFYFDFSKRLEIAESKIEKIKIEDELTDIICEKCGRNMKIKLGRFGKFLACSGYPDCKNTKPIFETLDVACPQCGSKILIKKTRKGKKYYICEKNPECKFISWSKPEKTDIKKLDKEKLT